MRAQGLSARWLAVAVVTTSALIAGVAGCGGPGLLDPTDDELAADRARIVDLLTRGMLAAGDQLGADSPLATRVDTSCEAGTSNWKIHDTYRSTCRVTVYGAFALDVDVDEALGGIEGLGAFEERMQQEDLCCADWEVMGNDPGTGVPLEWIQENGRPVSDVTGVEVGNDGAVLGIGFIPGSEPVQSAYGPAGGYYSDSQGADWENVWNAERTDHALLIRVRGESVLAQQSW